MEQSYNTATELQNATPPMLQLEICSFERELPFLEAAGCRFEIVDRHNLFLDAITIRLTVETGSDVLAYAEAMKQYRANYQRFKSVAA